MVGNRFAAGQVHEKPDGTRVNTIWGEIAWQLVSDGTLAVQFPPVMLRLKLDGELASRWADGHVAASTLWEDIAKYAYLPRLQDQDVLLATRRPRRFGARRLGCSREVTRRVGWRAACENYRLCPIRSSPLTLRE